MISIARLTTSIVKPRGMGLPDCAFDIVYALVNEDGLTQKQLCELGFSSEANRALVYQAHGRQRRSRAARRHALRTQPFILTGYGRKKAVQKPTFKPYWPPSMKPSRSSPMKHAPTYQRHESYHHAEQKTSPALTFH